MRVCLCVDRLLSYPDVTVVCGEQRFLADDPETLVNPGLIVEVLSRSTEKYDRGYKSARFRETRTLRGYLLIS